MSKNDIVQKAVPYIRAPDIDLAKQTGELADLMQTAQTNNTEIEQILERLRIQAGETGAAELATHYRVLEGSHRDSARRFLVAAVIATAVTIVLAIILFATLSVDLKAQTGTQWAELTRSLAVRLFFLSLASFAIGFLIRNYRVNKHLEISNGQKRVALETYGLFASSLDAPEARDVVTAELVKAVFLSPDTGFLKADQARTIIENENASVLGALLSRMNRT
jgi:hypothetical protein